MGDDPPSLPPASAPPRPPSPRTVGAAVAAVLAAAVAVRWPRAHQSLWADEMDSLTGYVTAPWRAVVAAGPGQFIPNNHVLYNVLAKACLTLGNHGPVRAVGSATTLVRLPSVVAGSLLPVVSAWPLRRAAPAAALLLAAVLAVHPWFVALSTESRGYALMSLLGVVATHLLPTVEGPTRRRWPVAYAVAVAAMLYTVSVAATLVVAHGLVVFARRRRRPAAVAEWLRGSVLAGGLTALLYLPQLPGIFDYVHHPLPGPTDYGDFANQLFRFALAGRYLPTPTDAIRHVPDFRAGPAYWLVPVAVLAAGTLLGRRQPAWWPLLPAMATATAVGLVLPVAVPTAVQVRFVPWCGLWLSVAMTVVTVEVGRRLGAVAGWTVAMAAVAGLTWATWTMPPEQPVREAIATAGRSAPPGTAVVVAFLGAEGASDFYADRAPGHPVWPAPGPAEFLSAEAHAARATGRRPWVVVSFEYMICDLRPDVWRYLNGHYRRVDRLPGRITPVAVYAPR